MEPTEVLISVTAERDDLDAKVIDLSNYRNSAEFNDLSEKQQAYLLMQLNAMTLYLDILNLRIDDLTPEAQEGNNIDSD